MYFFSSVDKAAAGAGITPFEALAQIRSSFG